jgi:hypothetical protein
VGLGDPLFIADRILGEFGDRLTAVGIATLGDARCIAELIGFGCRSADRKL